ncbi:hypothetical protein [Methanothermobacter thermautotrophicus]
MIRSKYAFLQRLTRDLKMKSISIGEELEGATPPSVFIVAGITLRFMRAP